MSYDKLRIAKIIQETPDARSFVLEIPSGLASKYRYKAGQFLTFRVDHPEGAFDRCYSFSSAPESGEHPRVTVKRVAGGKGSNWFHDALTEGSVVDVRPPAGRFVLKDEALPLLLFGAGSGITPLWSLIKSSLNGSARSVRLFYANRDASSAIFKKEIDDLAASGRLDLVHHLDRAKGMVSPEEIAAAATSFEAAEVYLCGPAAFMSMVEAVLLDRGFQRGRLHIERFEAGGFEASDDDVVAADDGPEEIVPARITVHIDGRAHDVPYRKGQTILEAARLAGLTPMSSCEQGFCASCAAKRLRGEVRLARNDVYTPDDLALGWILTCQGRCFGQEVEITYDVA